MEFITWKLFKYFHILVRDVSSWTFVQNFFNLLFKFYVSMDVLVFMFSTIFFPFINYTAGIPIVLAMRLIVNLFNIL